jgi:hypothetical protein
MRLNPSVYYHELSQSSDATTSRAPDLILVVGWMDAQAKHLSKYTSVYEKLHPSARIIIITTNSVDALLRTTSANLNRVKPALEILYSIPAKSNVKVLVHLFSNGGGYTSTLIAKAYHEKMGRQLPLSAMILDSSPGRPDIAATRRAFAVGLPKNFVLRFIGNLLFTIIFTCLKIVYFLRISTNLIDQLRADLNDKKLFDIDVPRLYIFSDGDNMVEAKDVEDHAIEARSLGYGVDLVRYIESGHAAHMLNDPKRYWKAVESLWVSTI